MGTLIISKTKEKGFSEEMSVIGAAFGRFH